MLRPRSLLLVLGLFAAACSGSTSSPPPPLGTPIGPAGGDLVVGSGLLTLSVPAGALAEEVVLRVTTGTASDLVGWLPYSSVFEFLPGDLTFATPATLVLPYSFVRQGATVDDSELRIAFRDAAGAVATLRPSSASGGAAVVAARQLGTYWVIGPDVVEADPLFPLNNNDTYLYDSGLTLTVERTTTEPNFGGLNVARIELALDGRTFGFYLDDRSAQLGRLGTFAEPDFQETFDASLLLIDVRDQVGTVRPAAGSYLGHAPFGSTTTDYRGITAIETRIAGRARVTVPLGSYETVHVVTTMAWSDTEQRQGDELLEFWFAVGKGPVALRLAADGPVHRLVEGTVAGQPIVPL